MTVAELVEAEKKLGDDLMNYAGRWVAVNEQQVVADADTLKALLEQIESQGIEVEAVLEVAQDPGAACFF